MNRAGHTLEKGGMLVETDGFVSSLIHGEPWQQAKRGCCLATRNNNEEISKLYVGKKKKCFGRTSVLGITVHQNSFMKHVEYIITDLEITMLYKRKIYQISGLSDILSKTCFCINK